MIHYIIVYSNNSSNSNDTDTVFHTFIHIYIYVYVCMYVCIYIYIYIYVYVYIYIYIYIYIYARRGGQSRPVGLSRGPPEGHESKCGRSKSGTNHHFLQKQRARHTQLRVEQPLSVKHNVFYSAHVYSAHSVGGIYFATPNP